VVALHGAGTTNIIFRQSASLSLLELHGDTFSGPGDMRRLCEELGFDYQSLSGPAEPGLAIHANFEIDCDALNAAIARMVLP
jgi:hypothetical protein